MHIAHRGKSELITVKELTKRVGLKRRQIAQLARNGKIPGAIRPDGYRYAYPVTPELVDWIEWKRNKVKQRRQGIRTGPANVNSGVITIQGLRQSFDIWFGRVGQLYGILKMPPEHRRDILLEIQPIARLHWELSKSLRERDSTKGI